MSLSVLLGPPSAGRSTCPALLGHRLGLPVIAARRILRNASQAQDASRLRFFLEGDSPVPAALLLSVLGPHLEKADTANGAILDGFPQTLAQAQALDAWLLAHGQAPTEAIKLDLPHHEALRRLNGRRYCHRCPAASYNIFNAPPQRDSRCDSCGDPLYQRTQDRTDLVLRRLERRAMEQAPLEHYYQQRSRLKRIDARGSVEAIVERIAEGQRAEALAVGF